MPTRAPVLLLALLLLSACAKPPAAYWVPDSVPVERLDFDDWDAVLRAHVRDGRVDYPGVRQDDRFRAFLDTLRRGRFTRDTTREQRLAFLINGYNAYAIAGILDGGSPVTLNGRRKFFLRVQHRIAGEAITLSDLQNERIRTYGDPRIHFALVCASASCPKLLGEAYQPGRLDEQLELVTGRFVNDPTRNRFDPATRTAQLSAIFDWYQEDFVEGTGSVAGYVARYLDDPEVARSLAAGGWKLRFLDYDWSLNGVAPFAEP